MRDGRKWGGTSWNDQFLFSVKIRKMKGERTRHPKRMSALSFQATSRSRVRG